MNFFNSLIRILRKPFPLEYYRSTFFRNLAILSLFVAFFLYTFQPFGLDSPEFNTLLISLGFGSMTFAGALVYELTVGTVLRVANLQTNWTFGKWILDTLAIMLFISMANFIFSRLILFDSIDWSLFPTMIYSTFMIGITPVIVLGGILLSKQERKYQGIADEFNQTKTQTSQNTVQDQLLFDIPTHRIKYIEALQNYVNIGFLNEEGSLKVKTERITLKDVIKSAEGSPITKCHRSYLVNRDAIDSAKGNAQGLLLSLTDCDKVVPVSRAYVSEFRG